MVIDFFKKYYFLIIAVLMAAVGYVFITSVGKEYEYVSKDFNAGSKIESVWVDKDSEGKAKIIDWHVSDKDLTVRLRSVSPGKVSVIIDSPDNAANVIFYVHNNGVITYDKFFGDCNGATVLILCISLYLLQMIGFLAGRYQSSVKKSLYSYDNVLYMGLIIFAFYLVYTQAEAMFIKTGINGAFYQAISSAQGFILYTFPLVFLTTVFVTISNIRLIRNEGRTWRNLLAFFLGLFLGTGALLPLVIRSFLQSASFIDVHYERGIGHYIEMFIENGISTVVAYLECILLGTILIGIKAARHIPKFNKDYIIINGCQIKKDGTLTNLLKSRTDRAVEFAKMQYDRVGRPVTFVPSGGQGSDEICSEGEAIGRYLLEQGISKENILIENRSTTTEENFMYSFDLINKHHGSGFFELAFSTSNYHVFRSGLLAEQHGIRAEGIGSRTKSYYWINAFVREFAATIAVKWRTHIKVTLILLLINIISTIMMYISEAVLF